MAQTTTAIDIGNDSVKIIALSEGDSTPEVVRVVQMPLEELGRLADGPEKYAALRARLAKCVSEARLGLRQASIAISGRTTMIRYIPVPPVPPWRLDAMMRFEATEQATARGSDDDAAVAGGCAYDYRTLDTPDIDGHSTVLLAMGQDQAVSERISAVSNAGVSDPDVDLTGVALYNAYVNGHGADDDMEKTVLLLDIGANEINIVITRSGGLLFARHQGGGGRQYTKVVAEALEIPWAEAEAFKLKSGRVVLGDAEGDTIAVQPDGEDVEKDESDSDADDDLPVLDDSLPERESAAIDALTKEASGMVRAVEATVMYARAQTKIRNIQVDKVLISGGGAKLPGLSGYIAQRLDVSVEPLQPLKKVGLGSVSADEMKPLEGNISTYAVAVGLALSRLIPNAPKLDLRREADKKSRVFRQHDLYLWSGAALLFLSLVFWIASGLREGGMVANAKDTAAELAEKDETATSSFAQARGTNRRLRADMEALRERVTSGEDILRVLSQLKKRTTSSIRLTQFSTSRPKIGNEPMVEGEVDTKKTFQSKRVIYLRGLASSTTSLPDAFRAVTFYQKDLEEAHELFDRVEQIVLKDTKAEKGYVAEFIIALNIARSK